MEVALANLGWCLIRLDDRLASSPPSMGDGELLDGQPDGLRSRARHARLDELVEHRPARER
jgi:hypothetical protein